MLRLMAAITATRRIMALLLVITMAAVVNYHGDIDGTRYVIRPWMRHHINGGIKVIAGC